MKRLITLAMTILIAVCMVACSVVGKDKTTKPNGLSSRFQAATSVTLDELKAEGTIKRFGDGMWEIMFTSPNTLSGVNLTFSEGNVTASYKGLNFSVPQSALPVKSMMLNLISAVDDLSKNEELSGVENDGTLEISGSLDGGDYTLTVDKSGNIVSFAMPNNNLSIAFSDVVPILEEVQDTTEENTTVPSEESTSENVEASTTAE